MEKIAMEQPAGSAFGARRDQDIALDLLKFIASATTIAKPAGSPTGFTAVPATKPEDQVAQLLDLYGRCLGAVQTPNTGR